MSPCAYTSLFICLCCEMTNCSQPCLEDLGWASLLPGGSTLCTHLKAQGRSSQEKAVAVVVTRSSQPATLHHWPLRP